MAEKVTKNKILKFQTTCNYLLRSDFLQIPDKSPGPKIIPIYMYLCELQITRISVTLSFFKFELFLFIAYFKQTMSHLSLHTNRMRENAVQIERSSSLLTTNECSTNSSYFSLFSSAITVCHLPKNCS